MGLDTILKNAYENNIIMVGSVLEQYVGLKKVLLIPLKTINNHSMPWFCRRHLLSYSEEPERIPYVKN